MFFASSDRFVGVLIVTGLTALVAAGSGAGYEESPPQLFGQHFRITVAEQGTFLVVQEAQPNGTVTSASGYLISMLQELADPSRANFTYDLLVPSGIGVGCTPNISEASDAAYGSDYRQQSNCATEDVNQLQGTEFGTDMFLGMFYVSPARQIKNYFTLPFVPPFKGTPAMVGTVTGVRDFEDLIKQQKLGLQPPACLHGSTATKEFVLQIYPELKFNTYYGDYEDLYQAMITGNCSIAIVDAPLAANFVLIRSQSNTCLANGKPIGMIGEPLSFGLTHYAVGVGRHLDYTVVETLSYWIDVLTVDGSLASLYDGSGGTGTECGYVMFPVTEEPRLSKFAILGIIAGGIAFCLIPVFIWHRLLLMRQERRFKKRFVRQIARNITIGREPGLIPPQKLCEEILHIGQGNETISKQDLAKWMHDIKMDFISSQDFDALWNAIDLDDRGEVDAVEFICFLSACGPEFEEVYQEQEALPKIERLKLAARRLSNIAKYGEDGVRKIEHRLERSSAGFATPASD